MFDFFQECINFFNEILQKFTDSSAYSYFDIQIVYAVRAVFQFIKSIAFAPLGLRFIVPFAFVSIVAEWKARHHKGGRFI